MNLLRKLWQAMNDRTGILGSTKPLLTHRTPPDSKWWYVFGSATIFAFLVQVITGIALATVYVPAAGSAYASLTYISSSPLGSLVRGIHFFGASAMILFVGMHLIRVFLMGSYKFPREMNWLTGVALLFLTVGMGFTGQLLRWDQNAVWSAIVGAEQAARTPFVGDWMVRVVFSGTAVGGATLSHFFSLHVFVIPLLIAAILGLHLQLVLRHGISEPPVLGRPVDPKTYHAWYEEMLQRTGQPFWPYAAWRDAVFGAAMIAGIVILAVVVGAPHLGSPPDPSLLNAQPRPDWYLLWYFAVLALLPHGTESYVIILAPLFAVLVLVAVPFISNRGERSWQRRPWAPSIVVFVVTCIGVLWIAGEHARWAPDFGATPLPAAVVDVSSGPALHGVTVFNTKGCLFCHQIEKHGGTRGPNLTDVGNRLSGDQMIIRILNGGYNMPAFSNNISPEQLNAVVAFLKSRREGS